MAVIGAALAFAANALSPRGLLLTKNYFPGTTVTLAGPVVAVTNATGVSAAKTNTPAELLSARFQAEGLQLADSNRVAQFFHDPRRDQFAEDDVVDPLLRRRLRRQPVPRR